MRKRLERLVGQRHTFTATFIRYGVAKAVRGKRIDHLLFLDVRNSKGRLMAHHIWMPLSQGEQMPEMFTGDVIRFSAEVNRYWKGEKHPRMDYGLRCPKQVELVEIEMETA